MDVKFTDFGLQALTNASINNPIVLEKFVISSDELDLTNNYTVLNNVKFTDYIRSKYVLVNNLDIECVIDKTAQINEGFYIKSIGLLDNKNNLIVIANVPPVYRPQTVNGKVGNENIFRLSITLANTNNITVQVQNNVTATQQSLDIAINRLSKLEKVVTDWAKSGIGVFNIFNTNNIYKDKKIITIGTNTWALRVPNNILNIADYPDLFKAIGEVEIIANGTNTGTFAVPVFHNGATTRQIKDGDSRQLGTFEDFAIENIKGNGPSIAIAGQDYYPFTNGPMKGNKTPFWLPKAKESEGYMNGGQFNGQSFGSLSPIFTGGILAQSFNFDASLVVKTSTETRMQNMAGQWYMLAKVNLD